MTHESRATFTCDVCGQTVELVGKSLIGADRPPYWFAVYYSGGPAGDRIYQLTIGADLCSPACLARWTETAHDRHRAALEDDQRERDAALPLKVTH